jgi:hypothetical protein
MKQPRARMAQAPVLINNRTICKQIAIVGKEADQLRSIKSIGKVPATFLSMILFKGKITVSNGAAKPLPG